jgi:hypothetical protein
LVERDRPNRRGEPSVDSNLPGLADLHAAVSLVASGAASQVTLCGFPDGYDQLRAARALAVKGIVIEPLIRPAGGGFDLRVRRAARAEG